MPFPRQFQTVVKNIFKRLFRVYAHIYYNHFQKIVSLGEEAHLNTCFKRTFPSSVVSRLRQSRQRMDRADALPDFYLFINEFNLVDKRETAPLQELIDNLALN